MKNTWESKARSLTKAFTWRVTGSIDTFVISFFVTGHIGIAAGIAGVEFFTKIFLYYLHERIWLKLKWGQPQEERKFDWRKPTVQMLGRWQPWHAGHRALFERSIKKTGQVCIMIRDCQDWNYSNPFNVEEVKKFIQADLDPQYRGMYEIIIVPNIINITYGRDVGYIIEEEHFDNDTKVISATKIRKELGY